MAILVASDPELFVKLNGKVSSIAGVLGYGKENKLDLGNGVRLQEDNVLLEFDIDPFNTFEGFNGKMEEALQLCEQTAAQHGFEVAHDVRSHLFSREELAMFPRSAHEFGCTPDFNGLTGVRNPVPTPKAGLRTAGGHVHMGYEKPTNMPFDKSQMVMSVMADYLLGMPSLFYDNDDRRRELYGKAGAIRYKDYGIEYRSLSNYWIGKEKYRKFVFDSAQRCHDLTASGAFEELVIMVTPFEVQRVIDESDRAMAEQYIRMMEDIVNVQAP